MSITITFPKFEPTFNKIIDKIDILHITLLNAILRFFVMCFPSDGGMIFDEVHYIKAIRAILEGIPANGEHPPLTKLIVGAFIKIFGDFWFSWRLPIVLFALFIPYLVYKISLKFNDDKNLAKFAATFSCLDILLFIHGNIYMLEIPALVMSLLFCLLYLEHRNIPAAIAISIGFLCNEKALWVLLGVAVYHIMTHADSLKKLDRFVPDAKQTAIFLAACCLFGGGGLWLNDLVWRPSSQTNSNIGVVATVYQSNGTAVTTSLSTITTTDYVYINDPISHVWFMVTYFSGIQGGIPQNSDWRPPWSWIGPFGPNWNNPPTYFATSISYGEKINTIINYRAQTTFPIWWMFIPLVLYSVIKYKDTMSKFILGLLSGTYLPWFIWELQKQNMPFNHYMLFATPVLCIAIPIFWYKVAPKYYNQILAAQILIAVVFFFYYFPVGLFRTF